MKNHVARDISCSSSLRSCRSNNNQIDRKYDWQNWFNKKSKDYDEEVEKGRNFWDVIIERYNLKVNVTNGDLKNIPKKACCHFLILAFGILDGLIMGYVLSHARKNLK